MPGILLNECLSRKVSLGQGCCTVLSNSSCFGVEVFGCYHTLAQANVLSTLYEVKSLVLLEKPCFIREVVTCSFISV